MVGEIQTGWVHVGRLRRARGNRGELIAEIYSSQPGRAERLGRVRLEKGASSRSVRVERVWRHDGQPVLKFEGIDSIAGAEEWVGADILVDERERARPEQGAYSHADLIGCTVLAAPGDRPAGVVRAVHEFGGPALLELESPDGGEILVPFAREICREIEIERKQIRAWLPEGLTEL